MHMCMGMSMHMHMYMHMYMDMYMCTRFMCMAMFACQATHMWRVGQ